jgi:hypothetical protein
VHVYICMCICGNCFGSSALPLKDNKQACVGVDACTALIGISLACLAIVHTRKYLYRTGSNGSVIVCTGVAGLL